MPTSFCLIFSLFHQRALMLHSAYPHIYLCNPIWNGLTWKGKSACIKGDNLHHSMNSKGTMTLVKARELEKLLGAWNFTLLMQFLRSGLLQYLDHYLLHFKNYFITALECRRGRRETAAIALLPNNFICKRIQSKCSCSAIKSSVQFKIQRNNENLCLGVFILFQTTFLFGSKHPAVRNKYCRVK